MTEKKISIIETVEYTKLVKKLKSKCVYVSIKFDAFKYKLRAIETKRFYYVTSYQVQRMLNNERT